MYHIADASNIEAIARDGLMSMNVLIRRGGFGLAVEERVRSHRTEGITLPDGCFVRDQRPMPPGALGACLDDGLEPRDWYDLANEHVFFWLHRSRALRHLAALRARSQVVLTVDARSLVAAYATTSYVTPFNIGNARRAPARPGRRTVVPLRAWQEHGWSSEALPGQRPRPASHPPAELLVLGAVPDLARYLVATERTSAT